MTDQAKFTNSSLEKSLEKQTKKQVDSLQSLNLSYKIDVLDQMKSVFLQNQMNDLILDMLREIRQLENDTKLNEVDYKAKIWKKNIISEKFHFLLYS